MIGKYYLKRVGGYDPLANAHSSEVVYLLWIAIWPETDTLTLGGVFSTRELAMKADEHFRKYRTIIEERQINSLMEVNQYEGPILEFSIHVTCRCTCGCTNTTAMGVQPCINCQHGFHEQPKEPVKHSDVP